MSRLELFGRPYVVFDPADKRHRSYYHDFVKTASWGRCPVRFVCPDDHGDLVTMMQRALIEYYTKREFKGKPVPAPLVRQKRQKTVDKSIKR
jgi:hypothetical protein